MSILIDALLLAIVVGWTVWIAARRWKEIDDEDENYDRSKGGRGGLRP